MTQYRIGYEDYYHKGKIVRSIVGNKEASAFVRSLNSPKQIEEGYIPAGFDSRPDLTAYAFYGDPDMFWFIMMFNVKPDAFEDFKAGDRLLFPKL